MTDSETEELPINPMKGYPKATFNLKQHIEVLSESDYKEESNDDPIHHLPISSKRATNSTVGCMFYLGINENKAAYIIQNIKGTPAIYQCTKIDANTSSPNIIFLKEDELRNTKAIPGLEALQLMDIYHNYVNANKDVLLLLRRKKLGFCFSTKNGPIYYVSDIPDVDTFICKLSNRNGYNATNDAYPAKVILTFSEIDSVQTYNTTSKIKFGQDVYSLYASYYFDLKTPSCCLLLAVILMLFLQFASLCTIIWCFDVAYEQDIIKVYEQSASPYICRDNQFSLDIICGHRNSSKLQPLNITDSDNLDNLSCNQRIINNLIYKHTFTVNIAKHQRNATFSTCNIDNRFKIVTSVFHANGSEFQVYDNTCLGSTVTNIPSGAYRVTVSPESDAYDICSLASYSDARDMYKVVAMIESPVYTQSFAEDPSWNYLSGYQITCIISISILTVYIMKDMMRPIKLMLACTYMDLMSVTSKIKIYVLSICLVILIMFAYAIGAWIITSSTLYLGLSKPFEILALPIGIVFILELDKWFYESLITWYSKYEESYSYIQVSKVALEDFKEKSWKLFIFLLVIQCLLSGLILIFAFVSFEQSMSLPYDVYISYDTYNITLSAVVILGGVFVVFVCSVIGACMCLYVDCNDDFKVCPCF